MKTLNSKMYSNGKYDRWWYNISSPHKIQLGSVFCFNLWDKNNQKLVRKSIIEMNKTWLTRLNKASTHTYKEREICKVHIIREISKNIYSIYFGRKSDGVYALP